MIDITFLGTAGSLPTKSRSLPSIALSYEGSSFLFDCGEGTQMQMMRYGVNPAKLKAIFLSHIHGDHVIGIAGLVRTLALNNRTDELKIFIPKGFEKAVKNLIVFDKPIIGYPISIIGINTGVIYKGKGFTVSAFKLNHNVSTYGFVFKEDDKTQFIEGKCKKLGIKGTMFADLEKRGYTYINGKRISTKGLTVPKRGKMVVYAADTRPTKSTITAAKHADVLIHESSFTSEYRELALKRKHSTVVEAAEIAKKAGAKMLIITHFSARYKNLDIINKEVHSRFRNSVAATDGYKLHI
jgi:ribonuclease Z